MKKQLISAGMSAILALAVAQPANATLIMDTYIGGDDHGYGDVIGDEAIFGIDSMNVEMLAGNWLSVTINTNFAGEGDKGHFGSSTQNRKGIGYGDLFLSDEWVTESNSDNFNSAITTDWSLGFSLNDRWTNGGNGSLYSLDGNDADDILLSDDFLYRNTFRNGQEIAVDTNDKKKDYINSSSWNVDDANNTISFLINLTGTSLQDSDTIALHWGMSCGNDTIEGEYSVPEPAMLGLLALGLIGIGFSQRNKSKV